LLRVHESAAFLAASLRRIPEQARKVLKELDRDTLQGADRWWLDAALERVK